MSIHAERFEFARDPERLSRFRREARTLASLNHPNIAVIYGLEESGDLDRLVMELVEGETLAARLQKGRLPMAIVLRYGAEVADARAAAHALGIVHRDLKPQNGLVGGVWGRDDRDAVHRRVLDSAVRDLEERGFEVYL